MKQRTTLRNKVFPNRREELQEYGFFVKSGECVRDIWLDGYGISRFPCRWFDSPWPEIT